jgi:hypothetical protein
MTDISTEPAVARLMREIAEMGYPVSSEGNRVVISKPGSTLFARNEWELRAILISLSRALQHSKGLGDDAEVQAAELSEKPEQVSAVEVSPTDPFETALNEVENESVVRSIWAQALAASDGEIGKARSKYIALRAAQLSQQAADTEAKTVQERISVAVEKLRAYAGGGSLIFVGDSIFRMDRDNNVKFFASTRQFVELFARTKNLTEQEKADIRDWMHKQGVSGLQKTIGRYPDYISRHWWGMLPLWQAYWVNFWAVTAVALMIANIMIYLGTSRTLLAVFTVPLVFWQIIGMWRSASYSRLRGTNMLSVGLVYAHCILIALTVLLFSAMVLTLP